MRQLFLIIILLSSISWQYTPAQVVAFPGADGYGRYASGGRGGIIYHVTTLEDNNNEGTLRYACTKLNKAIVIFDVAGTIHLNSSLNISSSNLTIAGQTAPGDGICIADYPVTVSGSNLIIRYLRFRMGDQKLTADEADGADAFGGRFCKNVIVDHCSVCWSTDECCSFYANTNFTMQWCIISESLKQSLHSKGPHGYGAIWGGFGASYLHNFMIHHDSRTPRFGTGNVEPLNQQITDMANNVFYNWNGNGCYGGEGMPINIYNNYYKPGPVTTDKRRRRIIGIDDATPVAGTSVWGEYYINGNFNSEISQVNNDNWYGVDINVNAENVNGVVTQSDIMRSEPIGTTPEIHLHTPQDAFPLVLAYAGCSKSRDDIDKRLAAECENGTYTYGEKGVINTEMDLKPTGASADWLPWPTLNEGTILTDSDSDGIPDSWETANGLNPNDASDAAQTTSQGYTNIEIYINSLVEDITNAQYSGSTSFGQPATEVNNDTESTDIIVNWSMQSGATGETASTTKDGILASSIYEAAAEIPVYDTRTVSDVVYTRFQPTTEYKTKEASAVITFTICLNEGVEFKPTTISFDFLRFGTGGGYTDVAWVDSNEVETEIESGINASDYKTTDTDPGTKTLDTKSHNISASSGKCQLKLYIYKLSESKQIGLANVRIGGHLGDSTSITNTVSDKTSSNDRTYNLMGRPASAEEKSIYIKNGKKFLTK